MPTAKPNTLIAALSVALDGEGKRIRLFPAGKFVAQGWGEFLMDDQAAASLLSAAAGRSNEYSFDYEHQALNAKDNGRPAPAAGWFSAAGLEWVPGDGFYANDVRWTDTAAAHIKAGEYKYVSPMFTFGKDRRPALLINAALTNTPAIDGQEAVAASLRLEQDMDLTAICKSLGIPEDSDPAAVEVAVAALKAARAADEAKVATLSATQYDQAKFVPLTQYAELQNSLAALTAQVETGERESLLTAALADGRILPGAKDFWASQPMVALKGYLAVAQPIAALSQTQTGGKPPAEASASVAGLDAGALAVCSQMGLSPEAFAASRKALGLAH